MNLEEIFNLLKKFNSGWFDFPIVEYNKDYQYKNIAEIPFFSKTEVNNIPNEIRYLYNQRVFQRLNYIKQLSFIYLFHLGGCHTRLEHTLGTLCIGKRYLENILADKDIKIENFERFGLYVALFIHDSCHCPFGHSLELIKKFLIPEDTSNERIDKILIKKYLKASDNSFRKAINQISPIDPNKFIEFLISLFDNNYKKKTFLVEILNSLIDADRLDYIPRDRYHIGISSNIKSERLTDLFSTIKIIKNWGSLKNKIVFSYESKSILDNVIDERAEMYNLYYHGEKSKIADTIIPHVFYQFLDFHNLILHRGTLKNRQLILNVLGEILKLSDYDFIRFINLIGEPWYAVDLLDNLLNAQIYIKINEWNIFDNIDKNKNELQSIFELANEKARERSIDILEDNLQIKMELHKEILKKSSDLSFEAYLFHFITNCVKEVQGKIFDVELFFWKEHVLINKTLRKKIIQIGGEKTGDERGKQFIDIPQVFIALPTYFPSFEEVIKYNHHPKEGEKSVPTLIYYPNKEFNESNIEKYLDNRPIPKQVKSYSLYILIPDYLKEYENYINEEFVKYIKSLDWWNIE